MIRILIADDHQVVREGLKRIIEKEGEHRVVAEAANSFEAFEALRRVEVDAAIIDISMPGLSGLDLLKQIRQEWRELPVLVLSMHPEDQYAIRVLKAGASGYLCKDSASERLIDAINKIVGGGRFVSPELAESLAIEVSRGESARPHERLSDREYQVLCLIAGGKSVTDIGAELSLSPKTISTYRSRILEKTGFKNNSEITHYAMRNGLV